MISWIGSLNNLASGWARYCLVLMVLTALAAGCAHKRPVDDSRHEMRLAVLPLENLSAAPAPLNELRKSFHDRLLQANVRLVSEEDLDAFMARYRVRHVGGIGPATSRALRDELGIDGVVVTTLELHLDQEPPKVSLMSRLVSLQGAPSPMWMESVSLAGDESPGFLDLGLVNDIGVLADRALDRLANSLVDALAGRPQRAARRSGFGPNIKYLSPSFPAGEELRIAVLPFVNQSRRRNAGELIGLHFVRQLQAADGVHVVEPGVVREELLRARLILPEGASLDTADLLFGRLDVDLLLSGKVIEYTDHGGSEGGAPRVEFTVQVISRKDLEVVWASQSSARGDGKIHPFGLGRQHVAGSVAAEMAREVVFQMLRPGAGQRSR